MSKADEGGGCTPEQQAMGWTWVPEAGLPGTPSHIPAGCYPPGGVSTSGIPDKGAGAPPGSGATAPPGGFPGANGKLGTGTVPGETECSPCSGATPWSLIPPGGAPCAGCIGSPVLPFPFHFMVGSPLPLIGAFSLPDPAYGQDQG